MTHRVRWRRGAIASAIALFVSLASVEAHALALGRITVQSLLGESLRAEIDIAEISPDEAASLRASVASAEAFKAAGLEYNPNVIGMQISLQKRPDGRSFLSLSSARAVTEPFVDLVLEASWSSGRVVRDYTMLFDPPSLRQPAPIAPTAPIVSAPATPSAANIGATPYAPPAPAVLAKPSPSRQQAAAKASTNVAARALTASAQQVDVKQGDTAGRIAAQNKSASISLDQMLMALLRRNPDAFVGGNVNRLKAGAVLDIPDTDQAASMSPSEASRTIVAQSRDFNNFRRKLAEGVLATQAANASRQSGGKVQAKVEDSASATAVPDKLTLSKGAVRGKAAAEEKIARDRQAKEATDRVAELAQNIRDLNKITAPAIAASTGKAVGIAVPAPSPLPAPVVAASSPASAAKPAANAPTVVATLPAAASSVDGTPTTSAPSGLTSTMAAASEAQATAITANTPASAPTEVASAPVAALIKKPVAVPPAPEPNLIDELTENPLMLGGIAALLVLLGALGFYRLKRRRSNSLQVDSSFIESRLQPDSFFGASGGQRVDTNESSATGSSLVYSPSQLDASGDVDPVAEADVYLAYGRDLQAEEILKEAMRINPTRVTIHAKLMEIYAKRRDVKAFEVVAVEAFKLTRGNGPDWAYIGEMGYKLDPANPMYQPGGRPVSGAAVVTSDPFIPSSAAFGPSTLSMAPDLPTEEAPTPIDFDLDLDFLVGNERKAAAPPSATLPAVTAASYRTEPAGAAQLPKDPIFNGLDMDFSTDAAALRPTRAEEPAAQAARESSANSLDFTNNSAPLPAKLATAETSARAHGDMLEFDLGSLSLDLGSPDIESPRLADAADDAVLGDPLETKFALAEEFRALGDSEGARSLAEEVVAQASGPLKIRAQAFISSLS